MGKKKVNEATETKVVETVVEETVTEETQVAILMPDVFKDIDFSALNKTITALGSSSKQLDEKEKKVAIEAINTWEGSVIERIQEKKYEASQFLNTLNTESNTMCSYGTQDEEFEHLVNAVGLQALYEDYLNRVDAIEMHKTEAPEYPEIDELNMTLKDQLIIKKDYELASVIYNKEHDKLKRDAYNAMHKLKVELNKDERVQELVKRLRKYEKNTSTFINQCKEKSQLAKISVSITSESVRDSLKELLNFSISI